MKRFLMGALCAFGVAWTALTLGAVDTSRWQPVLASIYDLISGEDETLNQLWVSQAGTTANVTQATASNQVKATAGEVFGFYVNSTNAGTIRFYNDEDGTCDENAKGGVITPAVGYHAYLAKFSTAICALTGGTAVDVTIFYR